MLIGMGSAYYENEYGRLRGVNGESGITYIWLPADGSEGYTVEPAAAEEFIRVVEREQVIVENSVQPEPIYGAGQNAQEEFQEETNAGQIQEPQIQETQVQTDQTPQYPYADTIRNMADTNYRQSRKNADRDAAGIIRYLRGCENESHLDQNIGGTVFGASRDRMGYMTFYYGDGTGAYNAVSEYELRQRISEALMYEARRNSGRDSDLIILGDEGFMSVDIIRDPATGIEAPNFIWTDNAGSRNISIQDAENFFAQAGWTRAYVEANRRNTWEESGEIIRERERDAGAAPSEQINVDRNTELGGASLDQYLRMVGKETQQPKSAMREALKVAAEENEKINIEVNQKLNGRLEEMERECPVRGNRALEINGQEFTVTKDENGQIHYFTNFPDEGQVLTRKQMQRAMFLAQKKATIESLKEFGHDELAIIPLDHDRMVVIRSADMERAEANMFDDGNKDFNFYLKDRSGNEKQITEKQMGTLFSYNNIRTRLDIKNRIAQSYKNAIITMDKFVKGTVKAAGRTAVHELRQAAVYGTVRQLSQGLQMGDEMARI